RNDSDNLLVKVAIAMRAHGRGGSLLVVPKNTDVWMDSIVQPMTYSVIPPFPDLGTFLEQIEQGLETSPLTLQSAVDALAGLTAVDGATVNPARDRKSTRLNSSHRTISYAVFCLKKKK